MVQGITHLCEVITLRPQSSQDKHQIISSEANTTQSLSCSLGAQSPEPRAQGVGGRVGEGEGGQIPSTPVNISRTPLTLCQLYIKQPPQGKGRLLLQTSRPAGLSTQISLFTCHFRKALWLLHCRVLFGPGSSGFPVPLDPEVLQLLPTLPSGVTLHHGRYSWLSLCASKNATIKPL